MHTDCPAVNSLATICSFPSAIVRNSPNNFLVNQLLYLALGDDSVVEVELSILPLHRAVRVKGIAQPIVGQVSGGRAREGGEGRGKTCGVEGRGGAREGGEGRGKRGGRGGEGQDR